MTQAPQTLTATVPDEAAGRRFDAVLAELFPDYSRSRLSAWIKSGDARLDGETARPRDPVRGGETVSVTAVLEVQTHSEPEDIALDVLYEDEHVIVINKPAGLVVHPGAGNPAGTLVNALLHRDPALANLPRAGIVHRLDKDTSGVMVVARTLPAHTALIEQLSGRQVHRQYLAVVVGALVSTGAIPFFPIWAGAALGAILGSTFSWWLGWRYGERILKMWPLKDHPELVDRAGASFRKWGVGAVFLGHFVGPLRPVIFLFAGMMKMGFPTFMAVNTVAALAWAWAIPKLGEVSGLAVGWGWNALGL